MALIRRGILVHPEDLTRDWITRTARAGINTLGLHPAGGRLAHETLQQAIDMHATPFMRDLRSYAADMGINVEYEAHAMAWLLPRHLFARHPDWFRMNESGERVADFNMCASNTAALTYVAERTAILASLTDTGARKYYFWTDDVCGYSCCCPECRGLTPSDQQLRIVNAMLRGLKTYDSAAKLCYLAYHDALAAPENVMPLEGVFLEYAPISRDHHRPIFAPDCPENADQSAPLPALIDYFGKSGARVLDYWMDNSLFSNWKRPPKPFALDESVMRADVAFYKNLGFEEITSFGCFLGPDYDALYGKADLDTYGRILAGE
ncbi:MAG: DUF4838 domain-containing protein [Clostridia bacterium]|nr:DUF4838 domain-containing protein [Clostridia bacterium]